jgi:hypothetical protein
MNGDPHTRQIGYGNNYVVKYTRMYFFLCEINQGTKIADSSEEIKYISILKKEPR